MSVRITIGYPWIFYLEFSFIDKGLFFSNYNLVQNSVIWLGIHGTRNKIFKILCRFFHMIWQNEYIIRNSKKAEKRLWKNFQPKKSKQHKNCQKISWNYNYCIFISIKKNIFTDLGAPIYHKSPFFKNLKFSLNF